MNLVGACARAVPVLEQWLRFDPGLLNLTGPAGVGKRSVIKALCVDDVRPIRLVAPQEAQSLVDAIARQLGVTPGAPAASIAAIREQSEQVRDAGYPVLVIIERAHLLADAALALLSRLSAKTSDQAGLAVALLSEQPLRERIRPLAPPQTLIQEVALVELNFDEANEHMDYLLTQGPWSGDAMAKLDRAAVFEVSGGNLAQLELCVERHRAGLPISGPIPGRKRVAVVFGVASLLAVLLSGVLVWQLYQDDAASPTQASLESLEALERELSQAPTVPEPLDEPEPKSELVVDFSAALADLNIVPEGVPIERLQSALTPEPEPILAEIPVRELTAVDVVVEPAPEPEQTPTQIAESAPQWAFDEAAILSSASNSYTLQVFGTRNPDTARREKTGKYTALDLNVIQVERDGSPWYVGLIGAFESRAAAQSFAREQQIEEGFWLRPLADVQDQIKAVAD